MASHNQHFDFLDFETIQRLLMVFRSQVITEVIRSYWFPKGTCQMINSAFVKLKPIAR